MNRFEEKKKSRFRGRGIMSLALSCAVILLFFVWAFSGISGQARQKETENLRRALEQSVIICYALEGSYPESLDYLKEHYGISWNEQRYLVDFETVGSNLPPDITIIER